MAPAGIGSSVEGLHAVAAAVAAGRVSRLQVEAGRKDRPDVARIVELAAGEGAIIEVVDDVRRFAATGAPQGVVASARSIRPLSLKELVVRTQPAAVLVLDHLEDPRNVGAIARSALAAGVTSLVVAERRAAPLEATAFKAAAGAFEHMGVAVVSSIAKALTTLGKLGLWRVGLDASGERSLFGCDLLAEPVAVVLGAEGRGLGRLVGDRIDALLRVPMADGVESLNASVAASLAVFELARMRGLS